jgi:hypothetical protein
MIECERGDREYGDQMRGEVLRYRKLQRTSVFSRTGAEQHVFP